MTGKVKGMALAIATLVSLTPALADWPYTIIRSFDHEYTPVAGPAVFRGGSSWGIVVIAKNGSRYLYEGNGLDWDEVGYSFDTPSCEVFGIDNGDVCALYQENGSMMLYNGYAHFDTGVPFEIDNFHDFCPLYNYPNYFSFESYGTLCFAEVDGIDVIVNSQWEGCDGDVSCVEWAGLGCFIFGQFGEYYRCIRRGDDYKDYYIGADAQAEGWITNDYTVYIAYVNSDDELYVITDTRFDEPVDEYVASSSHHPQLFANADGPFVVTDTMVYYKNSQGDWYGEEYKSWDNMGAASCVFLQNDKIFIIAGKVLSEDDWGIVSFYNDWHPDAPVVDFTGYSTGEGVLLSWIEDAELSGSKWTLERAEEALVTLSGSTEYRFLDRNIPGAGLYRYTLSVTPPDGNPFRVGPVEVLVKCDTLPRPVLWVPYPNPAKEVVTLEYALPTDCPGARLAVYDLAGRRMDDYSLSSEPGDHVVEVDCSAYAPGVYTAVLEATGETVTRRLVIAR